jgi:Flp pilus assembly protein TadG
MTHDTRSPRTIAARQGGSSALEFALVALLAFVPLLFGIVEVGLVFFALNFADEATRYVARAAVVCDKTPAQQATIKAHVVALLPLVFKDNTDITISYDDPHACIATLNATLPCVTVTVTPGVNVPNFIPFVTIDWQLPTLRTTLTPESFASAIDGSANPVCQ